MNPGVAGKILFVDLSQGTHWEEPVPEETYRKYLSGLGLGVRVLYDRIPPGADPLGPHNILGFVGGVLTGTGAMFAGRFLVVGKSPLTGGWGDANCGGNLAPALKACGYDGIFVLGFALEPVYLLLQDGRVELLPAADLWGRDTIETEDRLVERHGRRARVACIGPAGEKRVRFAGIANDHGRLAARSGLGAVMGSKNLKALVLDGKQKTPLADPATLRRQSKIIASYMPKGKNRIPAWSLGITGWVMSRMKTAFRVDGLMALPPFSEWGTASGNELCIVSGDAPVRNWRGHPGLYPARSVSAGKIARTQRKKYHCVACPLGCGSLCEMEGRYQETHRPEYETVASFGSNLLNRDLDSIYDLNEYCNRMGLDSISAGVAVAFAFDCYEHGLIGRDAAGGLSLNWGDSAAVTALVEEIAERRGLGDLLAEGVQRAAEVIGGDSRRFAVHAGGQELPMHDPRIDPAYGVLYVSDPTPGRHTITSWAEYEMFALWRKVSWAPEPPQRYPKTIKYEISETNARMNAAGAMYKALLDCAGLCLFGAQLGVDRLGIFEMLNAALGFAYSPDEYMEIGRRVQTLRQKFNLRHAVKPEEVSINPLVHGEPPAEHGPAKGLSFDLYAMRSLYWKQLGWDEQTGVPLDEGQGLL